MALESRRPTGTLFDDERLERSVAAWGSGRRRRRLAALRALRLALASRHGSRSGLGPRSAALESRLSSGTVGCIALMYWFQATRWRRIAKAAALPRRSVYAMLVAALAVNNVVPGG